MLDNLNSWAPGLFFLVIGALISWSLIDVWRSRPTLFAAWRLMDDLNKNLIRMGLLFCVVIPSLEDHGAANSYVGRVILEVMPALASGTLVPGVIALMRQVNRVRRRASRPESEEVPSC